MSAELLKQLQLPIGILACLQAGSVTFLSSYFEFIKVKYNMRDEIFDTVVFTQNASILFGILPGFLLYFLKPKKSTILGLLIIVASFVMTAQLIKGEHQNIVDNSKTILFAISFASGQGACLVLLALLQALMNMQTVLASPVITCLLFSYFFGGESLMQMNMLSLADETEFGSILMYAGISGAILMVACAFVVSDEEDGEGGSNFSLSALLDKGKALALGVTYSRTGVFYIVMLTVYTVVLLTCLFRDNLVSSAGTSALLFLVVFNLFVPLLQMQFLDQETIEGWMDTVTDHEKALLDKGVDVMLGEAASSLHFWYLAISSGIILGSALLVKSNARTLALQDADQALFIERIFLVFLVVGSWANWLIYKMEKEHNLLVMKAFITVVALAVMIYPGAVPYALEISAGGTAFASSGWLVCLSIFCHREYGTEMYGPIFGSLMTAGAAGYYAFNEVLFAQVFEGYAPTNNVTGFKQFDSYGEWNETLFTIAAGSAFIAFLLTLVSSCTLAKVGEE